MSSGATWPVVAGSYQVGDLQGPIAVCVNTSEHLIASIAQLPGVAIAGKVYTANLGIERIVLNVTANPAIRFLLLCGKDSPLFRPGQSLVALGEQGVDDQHRIVGALGYDPVLPTLAAARVAQFRRQVEIIDWSGEEDLQALESRIGGLVARNPGRFAAGEDVTTLMPQEEQFITIRPGGQREPLQYDPKGYFVITIDREEEQIVLRHYLPDHTPAHEMRGRVAGSMFLGLVREGLVSQLSHAGYLGEELAKAQAALHLGLRFDQDRPLRPREEPAASAMPQAEQSAEGVAAPATPQPPRMGRIPPALTWDQLQEMTPGATVDVVIAATDQPAAEHLAGTFLEADEADPFSAFRRTPQRLAMHWTAATRTVMGGLDDLRVGALLRVHGTLDADRSVAAEQIAVLTNYARLIEP